MTRPRVVIVGAGCAGYRAARAATRQLRRTTDVIPPHPTGYGLYPPPLPRVAPGVLEAGPVTVSPTDSRCPAPGRSPARPTASTRTRAWCATATPRAARARSAHQRRDLGLGPSPEPARFPGRPTAPDP
ncbi:hypothetical protein ABZX40_12070 [Streptomyces sp. NPDC004610]|uniref:hypothetical protein n=1 Tax=unclassified Streptomyces TaxID=2593676 RepID=UPI0033AD821F